MNRYRSAYPKDLIASKLDTRELKNWNGNTNLNLGFQGLEQNTRFRMLYNNDCKNIIIQIKLMITALYPSRSNK